MRNSSTFFNQYFSFFRRKYEWMLIFACETSESENRIIRAGQDCYFIGLKKSGQLWFAPSKFLVL